MFERFFVTSRGKNLEARLHAGDTLEFTKLSVGNGEMPTGQTMEAMTALVSPLKNLSISSIEASGGRTVVKGVFSNLNMDSFYFREIGLYADDPVEGEILYAYANAGNNADLIPAYSTTPVSFSFSFNIQFSNVEDITVVADSDLAFVTHAELGDEIEQTLSSIAVRYDLAQNLTTAQKAQARANIGAEQTGAAIHYSEAQTLTAAQKAQARANIGAAMAGAESISVPTNGWTGNGPFTVTVACTIATADNVLIVGPGPLTQSQNEAMAAAMIQCTAQAAGEITLTAYGDKPIIDLPICVLGVTV